MAAYEEAYAEITTIDGVNRTSTTTWRVPIATAKTYLAAADRAARDATAIGLLFAAFLQCTLSSMQSRRVYILDKDAPIAPIADTVLRGNKLVVGYESGGKNYTFTIPARDGTAYTQNPNEPTVDITAAGDFADFITALESTVVGPNNIAVDVTKAYLND